MDHVREYFNMAVAAVGVGISSVLGGWDIFAVIIVAHQMDMITGNELPMFKVASAYFYIANEAISITENISELGVPLPNFLVSSLEAFKKNTEKNMITDVSESISSKKDAS